MKQMEETLSLIQDEGFDLTHSKSKGGSEATLDNGTLRWQMSGLSFLADRAVF